jgi:translation elongation factor EF-1alpha
MSHESSITLVVTVGCLLLATVLVGAVNAAPAQAVATIVSVEGATTTYHSQDQDGQTVTVQVPSHSSADIKVSDRQGSVHATVIAVDTTINRVTVRTSEGQTIVLEMSPASLTSMQVGDLFTFTLPEPAR